MLRLLLAAVMLSALPAAAVQTVQGMLAGQDPVLDVTLEQRSAVLLRMIRSADRDAAQDDDPAGDACLTGITVPLCANRRHAWLATADESWIPLPAFSHPAARAPPSA